MGEHKHRDGDGDKERSRLDDGEDRPEVDARPGDCDGALRLCERDATAHVPEPAYNCTGDDYVHGDFDGPSYGGGQDLDDRGVDGVAGHKAETDRRERTT